MKKMLGLLLLALVSLSLAAGCGGDPKKDKATPSKTN